jgi:hypothetical protein
VVVVGWAGGWAGLEREGCVGGIGGGSKEEEPKEKWAQGKMSPRKKEIHFGVLLNLSTQIISLLFFLLLVAGLCIFTHHVVVVVVE